MLRTRLLCLLLGASLWTSSAVAQEPGGSTDSIVELTYDGALALARQQAPALAVARARAREAESRIDAASVWRFNPQVFGTGGPRFGADGTTVDWSLRARQWLEIGGQRGDRVAAARAGAKAETARSDDAQRLLLRDVSLAFVATLYWERRIALADENLRIAEEVARVAARRHEVGDVGGLETSVAALAVARAGTAADRARAARTQAQGRLKALLGLPAATAIACRGDLRVLGTLERAAGDSPGAPAYRRRPDLDALGADIEEAEAEARLGRARRVPDVAVGGGYFREESEDIIRATVAITLPVFDRGQGATAVARARERRLRAELAAARRTAATEIDAAWSSAQRLSDAARRFERRGFEPLERSERLATESYRVGAIPLGELLALRGELVRARIDYADLLLRAATARVELAAHAGVLR